MTRKKNRNRRVWGASSTVCSVAAIWSGLEANSSVGEGSPSASWWFLAGGFLMASALWSFALLAVTS
jgi:hypothetical protein